MDEEQGMHIRNPETFFFSRKSQNSISQKNEMISQNTGTLTTFYTLISSIRDYITTLYSLKCMDRKLVEHKNMMHAKQIIRCTSLTKSDP